MRSNWENIGIRARKGEPQWQKPWRAILPLAASWPSLSTSRCINSRLSVTEQGDALGTNFIGNGHNTPGVDTANSRWMGDLVTQVWDVTDTNPADRHWTPRSQLILEGKWTPELTGRSGDVRRVSFDGGTFAVNCEGVSKNEGGIWSFSLAMEYHRGEGNSLI